MSEQKRADTPLANSPNAITPITDVKTALSDIEKRSQARIKARQEANKKLSDAREARSRSKKPFQTGEGRLYGLASFSSTTSK